MRAPKPVVIGEATGCQLREAARVPAGDAAARRGGARWHRAGSGGAVFWLVPRTGWLAVWMVMVVSLVAGCRPDCSGRFQFVKSLRATERGKCCQVGARHGHTRPALEQYGAGVQISLGPFGRSRETVFLNPDYSPPSRGRAVTGSGFRHPAGYPPPGRSLAVRQ